MLDLIREAWSRRKWLALIVFVLPFTAASSLVMFLPNVYRSTATVLVERQQVPEALVRPTVTNELETRLRTISQEILSRSRLEALITRFGLYADLRKTLANEAVVEHMRRDIQLELKGNEARGKSRAITIAFAISYQGRDPETVAQVTNTLASFYIEENLKARERQAAGTAEFLKVQLQEARKRLDEQERRVSEFKKRHVGELPQQLHANLATLEQLNTRLRLSSLNRMRLEERRELLALQQPDTSPVSPSAPAAAPTAERDPAAARLAQLKQQLDELAARVTETHPAFVTKKAEIASLEQRIASNRQQAEAAPAPRPEDTKADRDRAPIVLTPQAAKSRQALGEVEAEVKVVKEEEARLRQALGIYEQRVANVPQREQEFQELSRDYESTKELYGSLGKRYEEAQLAESMEQRQKGEQFRLLEPALASGRPAAPKRLRLIMVGVVLSLGLAAGAVVLAEAFDTSFHTLSALREFTSVPVLTSIPRLLTDVDARRHRWRFGFAASGTALVLGLIAVVTYLVAHGNEGLLR